MHEFTFSWGQENLYFLCWSHELRCLIGWWGNCKWVEWFGGKWASGMCLFKNRVLQSSSKWVSGRNVGLPCPGFLSRQSRNPDFYMNFPISLNISSQKDPNYTCEPNLNLFLLSHYNPQREYWRFQKQCFCECQVLGVQCLRIQSSLYMWLPFNSG